MAISSQPVDPTAPLDPSVLARSGLSDETKKAAITEENRLRFILGTSFNDLATSEAIRRDYSSALSHYQEAERWDSTVPGLLRNLGVAAFRVQNYQECVRALSQVLAADPSNATVRAMMAPRILPSTNIAKPQEPSRLSASALCRIPRSATPGLLLCLV